MKRFILLAFALMAGYCAYAQDLITRKDGTDIQAKILEVTTSEVKYKKASNPDGPIFTISKSDILIVRYANGENEIFDDSRNTAAFNTNMEVFPGMRYKDYKDYYNTRLYVRQPGDPYTPFWIGFADFFITGLGNGITGEWGRAAGFFFADLGLGLLSLTQVNTVTTYYSDYYNDYDTYIEYTNEYWLIVAAQLGLKIWSICDAVHVAKAKNMYNQDLRARRASFDCKIEPYFAYTPSTPNHLQPVGGFSLKVNF